MNEICCFSGFIGRSWSMLFAAAGYHVSLFDSDQSQLTTASTEILTQLQYLKSENLLSGNLSASEIFSQISSASTLKECLQNSFYVQVNYLCVINLKNVIEIVFIYVAHK